MGGDPPRTGLLSGELPESGGVSHSGESPATRRTVKPRATRCSFASNSPRNTFGTRLPGVENDREMEENTDKPKWLLELENRKRKPRLAHEAGAGAPCMVCSSACPGLDLHFWRKICKNCKCSRDDHDVEDDEFPQFDLLFGSSKKFKRKPILLRVNNEKQHEAETAFEWVPPDTTKELATDYMKALPAEKLPIKGTAGAALRRQLLQKQLPLHDIDHKVCDELTEQEQIQFEKYLENIKKYVGQGKVTKILSARPFDRSLMTPANATDMQRFSPQHRPSLPGSTVQLRTLLPCSCDLKNPCKRNEASQSTEVPQSETFSQQTIEKQIPYSEMYNFIGSPSKTETAKSEPIKGGVCKPSKLVEPVEKHLKDLTKPLNSDPSQNPSDSLLNAYKESCKQPDLFLSHSKSVEENLAESMLADALLPPSNINSGDIIGSTLDEKRLMFIREKLMDKYTQENQMIHNSQNVSRDLEPGDLPRKGSPLKSLNNSLNTDKESGRSAIIAAMKNPSGTEGRMASADMEGKPVQAEREIIKPVCQMAQSDPIGSSLVSRIERERPHQPRDGQTPVPLASRPQMPLPPTTDEPWQREQDQSGCPIVDNHRQALISSSTFPSNVIHSESLHSQVFPHEAIGTGSQVIQNIPNVEHLRGAMEELRVDAHKPQKCHNCEEEIRIGDVAVITERAKNSAWHPGCFVCSVCNELLADLVHFYYKNKLYCGRDLAMLLGIPRCFACDELIFVREYTVAEGHNYHVKHFCCWDCDLPLAGQQYITENDRPLCLPCYQRSYAKTCNACQRVIAADQQGVAVKNLNFHATEQCFCCFGCGKNLLNGRMAVKEDRLFCSKECISQFLHPQA